MLKLRRQWAVGASMILACASLAIGQPRPTPGRERPFTEEEPFGPGYNRRPNRPRTPTPGQPEHYSFSGEYQEMVTLLKFTKHQQKALYGIVQAKDKAIAKFDKRNEKKLTRFREKLAKAKNDIARKAIQRQIDLVTANRQRLIDSYKRRGMNLFTPKQKAAWASHKLRQLMAAEFASAGLSSEQSAKVQAICDRAGKTAKTADVQSDKILLSTVKRTILTGVLNAEQRRRYAEAQRQKARTG